MAVYDLEEQEQLDELKAWWRQYGNLVTAFVVAAAVAAAGWQGWNWWQRDRATQASALYSAMQQAVVDGDAKRASQSAGEIIDRFPGTAYAGLAALVSAKVQVDKGDSKNARVQLQWAAEHAKDAALRDLARLRLAALLIDEKAFDDALKQLSSQPAEGFASRFSELRGDALTAQGKVSEARTAYQDALTRLEKAGQQDRPGVQAYYRDVVQAKLDSLGTAK